MVVVAAKLIFTAHHDDNASISTQRQKIEASPPSQNHLPLVDIVTPNSLQSADWVAPRVRMERFLESLMSMMTEEDGAVELPLFVPGLCGLADVG